MGAALDIFPFYGRMTEICKDNAETKRGGGLSARGRRWKPPEETLQAIFASPGKTGTGAPVTERLRCLLRRAN